MQLVAKWKASGETAHQFGARYGVTARTLYGWARNAKKAAREAAGQPAFVEVQLRDAEVTGGMVEIVLAGGRVVRVRELVDPRVLRAVVEALEGSC